MARYKMKSEWIISLSILVTLIFIAYSAFSLNDSQENDNGLPVYALKDAQTQEAYLFARDNPLALDGVNCHCGCMSTVHNGRVHRRGLLDCFIQEDRSYEIHGAQCAMCIIDALQVKQLTNEGKTKEEIKSIIDSKYY